jgi:hypothetical protein
MEAVEGTDECQGTKEMKERHDFSLTVICRDRSTGA